MKPLWVPALLVTWSAACVPPPSQPSYFGQGTPPPGPSAPGTSPEQPTGASAEPGDPWGQAGVAADGTSSGEPSRGGSGSDDVAPASGLALTPPGDFRLDRGWYISKEETPRSGYVATVAGVAFTGLPATTPQPDAGATLRAAWAKYMPPEAQGVAGGMVFRRYVGDGLSAFYLHGSFMDEPRHKAGWYSLYLIDCGASWQPMIVGGLYEQSDDSVGFEMMVRSEPAKGLAKTEPLLASVRCAGPRNQALFSSNLLVGHYYYGSGASQDYVHIYTGESSTHHISYAGEYDLRADGTVSYRHSAAGDVGAGTRFAGEKAEGRWKVDRDLLVLELRGLGTRSFRIASITDFSDARLVVLLDTRNPAAPLTVGGGTVLSTKQKR